MSTLTTSVAQAQPTAPSAGRPSPPKANQIDNGILTSNEAACNQVKIYALYKQATTGDNAEKKPGFTDMVGRAKWDAWNGLKGTSTDDAMQQYIDLIESLS